LVLIHDAAVLCERVAQIGDRRILASQARQIFNRTYGIGAHRLGLYGLGLLHLGGIIFCSAAYRARRGCPYGPGRMIPNGLPARATLADVSFTPKAAL
jgi:hypothetical protein